MLRMTLMTKIPATLVLAIVSFSGCAASSASDVDIATTNLAGTVSGQPWVFQAGSTDAFLSEGDGDFFAAFYPSAYTPCVDSDPTGPHLIASIPKQPGDYDMSLSRNMTFADGLSNLVTIDGRVVIETVTATTVTGGLHGTYNGGNEVNGKFQLTICPDDEAPAAPAR